jgi:hypothetical protein
MDEQFKNLKFDMDEEMQERQARVSASRKQPIDTGTAIIIAALILVAGIWGGKVYYDYIQEQRALAALKQFSQSLNSAMQESTRRSQQYARESAAQNEQRRKVYEAEKTEALRRVMQEQAQQKQEARQLSPQCRFWRDQYESNPTERATNEYRKACGY